MSGCIIRENIGDQGFAFVRRKVVCFVKIEPTADNAAGTTSS